MANVNGCWNWFDTRNGRGHAEAALTMRAIDQACLYGADRTRVAIAGLSAGATMAALVVTRYPDRFQSVAMHSGVPRGTARSGLGALSAMYGHGDTKPLDADAVSMAAHWPALLVGHGGTDRVVTPGNAEAAVNAWAEAAGARAQAPRTVPRGKRYAMHITDYRVRRRTGATLGGDPKGWARAVASGRGAAEIEEGGDLGGFVKHRVGPKRHALGTDIHVRVVGQHDGALARRTSVAALEHAQSRALPQKHVDHR